MPDENHDNLQASIAALYLAFKPYKVPPHVDGCPHCVSDADNAAIHSHPLRQLGPGDLHRFAFKAMTTWGTVNDFRHFLPRLFELVAADGGGMWIDPEVLFGKLSYGGWTRWHSAEQGAVRRYLHALWRDVLGRFPQPFEADSCLCCFAQAEDDVRPFLDVWDVTRPAALSHFKEFLNYNGHGSRKRRQRPWELQNPWWHNRSMPADQVKHWVLAPERLTELERSFFSVAAEDEATAASLSEAITQLCWVRTAAGVA